MKKRLFIVIAAAVLLLSGCRQRMTAAVVAARAFSNLQKTTSAEMDLEIGLKAKIDASALSDSLTGMSSLLGTVEADIDTFLSCETTADPSCLHCKGTTGLNIPFLPEIPLEVYALEEDGQNVMYTGAMNFWTRKVLPEKEENKGEAEDLPWYSILFGTWDAMSSDMVTMEEETVELGTKECYLLHAVMPSSVVYDFLSSSLDLSSVLGDDMSGVDFGDQTTPLDFWIEKETLLPLQIYMSDAEFANTLLASSKLNAVNMGDMQLKVTYKSFNSVESITVPEEIRKAARDAD